MSPRVDEFMAALSAYDPIALDTSACIYYLGGVHPWFDLMDALVEDVLARRRDVYVSSIVQLELLVRPVRTGDRDEVQRVFAFTERQDGIQVVDFSSAMIPVAANVRAHARLKLADAMIAASASLSRCQALVGNDKQYRNLDALSGSRSILAAAQVSPKYIHLDDYIDAA